MPIIVTTNDGEQQFTNKEEVKFNAVQAQEENQEHEKPTKDSAAEENENNEEDIESDDNESERDKSLDYLNSDEEDEDSDEHDDDEEDIESDDEEQVDKPKKNGIKKRIDKLLKKNSESEARYEARIASLEAQLRGNNPAKPAQEAPVIEDLKEPDVNEFEDYNEYIKALGKYSYQKEKQEDFINHQNQLINKQAEEITAKYKERVEEAKQRYGADKWNNLGKIDAPLSITVRSSIMQSDYGPDILFYLLNNLEENNKIFSMSDYNQQRAIIDIERKVSEALGKKKGTTTPKQKVTNAPKPAKPISSKTDGKVGRDPSKMNYKEFKAWREKQN